MNNGRYTLLKAPLSAAFAIQKYKAVKRFFYNIARCGYEQPEILAGFRPDIKRVRSASHAGTAAPPPSHSTGRACPTLLQITYNGRINDLQDRKDHP